MTEMIDLASLLAEPERSGAYYIDAHDRAAAVEAAAHLDFALLPVELRGCRDKDEGLRRISAGLQFPEWFGHNWDALADSLNDMSWVDAPGYLVVLDHADDWHEADPEGFATLLDIFNEAALEWARLRTSFWMLIPMASVRLDAMQR